MKKKDETEETNILEESQEKSEKEELLILEELMHKYGVHSIGDVEVKLSRL